MERKEMYRVLHGNQVKDVLAVNDREAWSAAVAQMYPDKSPPGPKTGIVQKRQPDGSFVQVYPPKDGSHLVQPWMIIDPQTGKRPPNPHEFRQRRANQQEVIELLQEKNRLQEQVLLQQQELLRRQLQQPGATAPAGSALASSVLTNELFGDTNTPPAAPAAK